MTRYTIDDFTKALGLLENKPHNPLLQWPPTYRVLVAIGDEVDFTENRYKSTVTSIESLAAKIDPHFNPRTTLEFRDLKHTNQNLTRHYIDKIEEAMNDMGNSHLMLLHLSHGGAELEKSRYIPGTGSMFLANTGKGKNAEEHRINATDWANISEKNQKPIHCVIIGCMGANIETADGIVTFQNAHPGSVFIGMDSGPMYAKDQEKSFSALAQRSNIHNGFDVLMNNLAITTDSYFEPSITVRTSANKTFHAPLDHLIPNIAEDLNPEMITIMKSKLQEFGFEEGKIDKLIYKLQKMEEIKGTELKMAQIAVTAVVADAYNKGLSHFEKTLGVSLCEFMHTAGIPHITPEKPTHFPGHYSSDCTPPQKQR